MNVWWTWSLSELTVSHACMLNTLVKSVQFLGMEMVFRDLRKHVHEEQNVQCNTMHTLQDLFIANFTASVLGL